MFQDFAEVQVRNERSFPYALEPGWVLGLSGRNCWRGVRRETWRVGALIFVNLGALGFELSVREEAEEGEGKEPDASCAEWTSLDVNGAGDELQWRSQ